VLLASGAARAADPAGGPTGGVEGTLQGLGRGQFVVYVDKVAGATYQPMNPAPVLGQKNNVYIPHVLPIVVGSKVELRSDDPELHNVYAWAVALKRALFNIAILPKTPPQYQTFSREGVVKITCNVHKEMLAFILVLQNPHFALVDKGQSTFRIAGVPAGKYELRVWGEKLDEATLAKKFPVEIAANGTAKITLAP
jgi:plastocyanin